MLHFGRGVAAACQIRVLQTSWTHLCRKSALKRQIFQSSAAAIGTESICRQQLSTNHKVEVSNAIGEASEVASLLEAATRSGSVAGAFQGLHRLSEWVSAGKVDYKADLENDATFFKLLKIIERSVAQTSPTSLLAGLKSLANLGVDSNSYLVQSLENEVLWNVRKISVPLLLSVLVYQAQHQHTDLQRKVLKETVETIQRRWVEVRGARDIQMIYTHHEFFSMEFIGRMDDRTIELAEEMSYLDLSRLVCALGSIKRRATPVLRALAFHMSRQSDKLPPKQLSNVLYAMNSLSFPDSLLLEKIANDLVQQANSIDRAAVVGAILVCMGQMRWRNSSLLEIFAEWVEVNVDKCRISDMAALILTLAAVSYTPTNIDSLLKVIIPKLMPETVQKETAWLDIVWSLVALGWATEDQVASVLAASFVSQVPCASHHQHTGIKLKLLNINAAAKLTMPQYKGPFLDLSDFKDVIITQGRHELILGKHIQAMLHNFLPPPKYIRENVQTNMGIFVDVELAVDKDGKPIPIQDFSTNFGETDSVKELPDGAQRIAMLIWDYRDYTIGSQELSGVNKLGLELIKKQNYKVVQIPYFEYNMKAKTVKCVQYLESKLKESVTS